MDTFVAAVDLGASSGRVLLACLGAARETLSIEEVHRFDNGFVNRDGHDCWDVDDLVAQAHRSETGLRKSFRRPAAPHPKP